MGGSVLSPANKNVRSALLDTSALVVVVVHQHDVLMVRWRQCLVNLAAHRLFRGFTPIVLLRGVQSCLAKLGTRALAMAKVTVAQKAGFSRLRSNPSAVRRWQRAHQPLSKRRFRPAHQTVCAYQTPRPQRLPGARAPCLLAPFLDHGCPQRMPQR